MITKLGYFVILIFIVAVFLTLRILKKLKDKGCFAFCFIYLLVFSVISIFLSTLYITTQSLNKYINGESIEGKIIDFKSYEKEYKDSNNKKSTTTIYIPIIEFTNNSNKVIKLESSIHSSNIPEIGKNIIISYNTGDSSVLEQNLTSFFLFLGAFVFAIIFGFLTIGIFKYSLGYSLDSFKNQFVKGFFIGIKMSLILFTFAFILPIYNYIIGNFIMPLWVFLVCTIFFIVLILLCYLIFIKKNKTLF